MNAGSAAGDCRNAITGHEAKIEALTPQRDKALTELKRLERVHAEALQHPDCDHDVLPPEYDRLWSAIKTLGETQAFAELDQRIRQLESQIQGALGAARDSLVDFINEYSIGLVEERSDWRKAQGWVGRHIKKLNDSTLADSVSYTHLTLPTILLV